MKAKESLENSRITFSHIEELLEVPDLLSIQTKAYQQFLQEFQAPEARGDFGLQGVLNSVFPIEDSHRNYILEFMELGKDLTPLKKHFLEEGNFSDQTFYLIEQECKEIYNTAGPTVDPEILREIETLKSKLKQLMAKGCKNKCKN